MYSTVADIRALLPGVPAGQAIDALITRAIEVGDTEIDSRIGAYIKTSPTPPLVAVISRYLGASTYLLMSMSAGQETEAPALSIHYRKLADKLMDGVIAGNPVVDADGEQVGAGTAVKSMRSYTMSSLGVRS